MLVKPLARHLVSYPNIYEVNATCVDVRFPASIESKPRSFVFLAFFVFISFQTSFQLASRTADQKRGTNAAGLSTSPAWNWLRNPATTLKSIAVAQHLVPGWPTVLCRREEDYPTPPASGSLPKDGCILCAEHFHTGICPLLHTCTLAAALGWHHEQRT